MSSNIEDNTSNIQESTEEKNQPENMDVNQEEEVLSDMDVKEEEEDKEQKETDERIKKRLNEIREEYNLLIERIDIHKNILKEIKESEESKQVDAKDQLKTTKKILMENQIKLEKLLLSLDSLVGASEKVRPLKKGLVVEIQGTISEIDVILEDIKNIEKKIEQQLQQIQQNQAKESQENDLPTNVQQTTESEMKDEESEEKEEDKKEEQAQAQEQEQANDVETKSSPSTPPLKTSPVQSRTLETSPVQKQSSPTIHTKEEKKESDEDDNSFPFPSNEDWERLKFDPKFNVQQLRDRYVIFSKIPNLDTDKISIKANNGILSIEGVKYPTKEEKNFLAKRLVQSLRNSYLINRLTRSQIISAILRLASEYNFGKFSVKYELPSNIDSTDDIDASYKNGILQIELPIKNKIHSPHSQSYYKPEVPFYGYNNRRRPTNNFWDFF